MYIYKDFVTDEYLRDKKKKVLRRLWMNVGQVDIYLVCLNSGVDQFDIIHTAVLKQKSYPKKDIYLLGIAKGWESAANLAGELYLSLSKKYGSTTFKDALEADKATLFRRF